MHVFLFLILNAFSQESNLGDKDLSSEEKELKKKKADAEYSIMLEATKNQIKSDIERKKYDKNYQE